jgi:hypothetical protein
MSKNSQILEHLGKSLIMECLDPLYYPNIINSKNILELDSDIKVLHNLSDTDLEQVAFIVNTRLEYLLFNFIKFFEEHDEFKFVYENDNQKLNLADISDDLKSELVGEGGWIEKYSQVRGK